MRYVIMCNGRVVFRSNVRSQVIRLASFFRGVACIEQFGHFSPIN